jgi:hypothetical protein
MIITNNIIIDIFIHFIIIIIFTLYMKVMILGKLKNVYHYAILGAIVLTLVNHSVFPNLHIHI